MTTLAVPGRPNVTSALTEWAKRAPEATALVLPQRRVSCGELDSLTWNCAGFLRDEGITAGAVVALTFVDDLALIVTMLAVLRIGATVFSIPRNATAFQRREMAENSQSLVLASDRPDMFDAGLAKVTIDLQARAGGDAAIASVVCEAETAAFLISGSGSTGKPKLIPLTHAQVHGRIHHQAGAFGLREDDVICALSHLDFFGSKLRLLEAIEAGAPFVVTPRDLRDAVTFCRDHSVTVLHVTVFHLEQMLGHLAANTSNALEGLRVLNAGSSTVSDDLRQRVRRHLTGNLFVRYGTNESGQVTTAGPPHVFDVAGCIGQVEKAARLEVVDAENRPVAPGTVGLIRIKSPGCTSGYRHADAAAARYFHDGWFYPQDLGKFDDQGNVIFYGRADDMMIMNGINIYPAEVERVVQGHPAIADVATAALKHRVHQDVPVCAVVLRAGEDVSESELLSYARERLGAHGPHRFVFLAKLPRNEQGKLVRAELTRQVGASLVPPRQPARGMDADLPFPAAVNFRQLPFSISLIFETPQGNLGFLDAWLTRCFDIDVEPSPPKEMPLLAWLWRWLLLARVVLQAGRVPVFDEPRIIALRPDDSVPDRWKAVVQLASVDGYRSDCYDLALRDAINWCARTSGTPVTDELIPKLLDELHERTVLPLVNMVPSGKSTLPVLRVAHQLGIPFNHLAQGAFQLGWGSKAKRIDRSTTDGDSAIGLKLAHNKVVTASLLRMAGLPAPEHALVRQEAHALAAAHKLGWPIVIKPADRERGEGVVVDVSDDASCIEAFRAAQALSKAGEVIVERQVSGVCHRLFIVDGKLLYAVKRLPMSVRGDGQRTVGELVAEEVRLQQMRPPWLRSEIAPIDAQARAALQAAGLSESSVPASGVLAPLRRIESTESGGVDEDVSRQIHPANLQVALKAAELFRLHVSGIDIITPDISRPWHENGAIINEVNFSPLLGGAEISRSHIPGFLEAFVPDAGRIPVEIFVGGTAAMSPARQRWLTLTAGGLRGCLCTSTSTQSPDGTEIVVPLVGLFRRCRALMLDPAVDAIVLVVQDDEFLSTGLPVEFVASVVHVDSQIASSANKAQAIPPERAQELLKLLARASSPQR